MANALTEFLQLIGFQIILEQDKTTIVVGGNKRPKLNPTKPPDPPSDDSDVTGDNHES